MGARRKKPVRVYSVVGSAHSYVALLVRGRVECDEYSELSTPEGEVILINATFEGERVVVSYIKEKGQHPEIVVSSAKYSSIEVSIPGLDAFSIRATPIAENDLT